MVCYLIHFERPIGNPDNPHGQAQHYIGCTENLKKRIDQHRFGRSASIVRAFYAAGIKFKVARTWEGGRDLERKLKNRKNAKKLCPICRGTHD